MSYKNNDPRNLNIFSQESVINSVGKFIYKPEEVTFEAYFRRYESIFEKDCEKWLDEKNSGQHGEVSFQETIQILRKMFGEQSSLFNTH